MARDPYEILGVARGASFEEVKSAYRRACKVRHPDMGGSHEAMVELNTAYAFILNELKSGYWERREEAPRQDQDARAQQRDRRHWEQDYRDIDDELEEMRRAAGAHEEALRAMRSQAWEAGDRAAWARLTWEDFSRFVRGVARSGVKGLALLFAALVGIGSVLVEANVVSALILLGSALGFLFSLALKSDKGGVMSAGFLLFGIMTLWLPPVRHALFLYPLATLSVLALLALVFKFVQAGGTTGLMTGGVLALYVVGVIVSQTAPQQQTALRPPIIVMPSAPAPQASNAPRPAKPPPPSQAASAPPSLPSQEAAAPEPPPASPEPRTLLASQGALLKFVAGIPYHLKVRTGFTTSLRATQGKVSFASAGDRAGQCVDTLELPMQAAATPYQEIDHMLRACGADAIMTVSAVR